MSLACFFLLASLPHTPDLSLPLYVHSENSGEVVIACSAPGAADAARHALPIVTDDEPRARWAAQFLAASIQHVAGVRPALYVKSRATLAFPAPALRVVASDDTSSFAVVARQGGFDFVGRSDYAVFDWCERFLGVRLYPTDGRVSGFTAPTRFPLVVPAISYADAPVFNYRVGTYRTLPAWRRVLKHGGEAYGGVNVHAPHHWFEEPGLRRDQPHLFARQRDGSRGEMPLLCYGHPETLAYYKRRIHEHIAGIHDSGGIVDTNRHVVTVSHWDVPLECTCEVCTSLFQPSAGVTGSGSPIIWGRFLKPLSEWLARAHPDYTISFLPYLNACDVPCGLDLADTGNCEAMVCSMPGLALFKEPRIAAHEERLIAQWVAATGRKVLNWHYQCWPRSFTSAPYLFGETIAAHYRRMRDFSRGSFICGEGTSATDMLNDYIWQRCLWNPDFDVAATYDEYARRMFGGAFAPMRRLMALQESCWARSWPHPHCSLANTYDVSFRRADVREMARLLAEAQECVWGDASARARVAWYAAGLNRFFREEALYRAGKLRFAPFRIGRTATPPRIDGRLDDACWQAASSRALVPAYDAGQTPLARPTQVWAVWDEKGVYFALRCHEPEMAQLNRTAAYGELRKQDTLEIFYVSDGTATGVCRRVMIDVRNRLSSSADDGMWCAEGVRTAVHCAATAWCVEVFLPATVTSVSWRGNIARWHPDEPLRRETSRLTTLGGAWHQDRDAFSDWIFIDNNTTNEHTKGQSET